MGGNSEFPRGKMEPDHSNIILEGFLWLYQQVISAIISTVALEALGISAVTTTLIKLLTKKIETLQSTAVTFLLVFVGLLIAINSFGNQIQRPNFVFIANQIASGIEADSKTAFVMMAGSMTNRGNVASSILNYNLDVTAAGKSFKGTPRTFNGFMSAKINDNIQTFDPREQLLLGQRIFPVGIPVFGFVIFEFKDLNSEVFANLTKYNLTVIDSFGGSKEMSYSTHGERMGMPWLPIVAPSPIPTPTPSPSILSK
jgi:hypothetical protein